VVSREKTTAGGSAGHVQPAVPVERQCRCALPGSAGRQEQLELFVDFDHGRTENRRICTKSDEIEGEMMGER
jgi:hypothetical protein